MTTAVPHHRNQPQLLNLMDCDGLEGMEYASHERANTPAALVAHTILDVVDDFDAPAKGLADYSFTNSPGTRLLSLRLRFAFSVA